MKAEEIIKPFLLDANRMRPNLAIDNTSQSCGELLQLTLALAGPDWFHVAKTNMDGASVTPPGFVPFSVSLKDHEGVVRQVQVIGVSQDAAFHAPTNRQVKVIAFSGANDPGPWEHGPAKLTPYEINPGDYRWHNPPMKQFFSGAAPSPAPTPTPAPRPVTLPSYNAMGDDAFFVGAVGAFVAEEMATAGGMNAGSATWIARAVHGLMERFIEHGDNRDKDAIAKKVRNELRAVLGRPPL